MKRKGLFRRKRSRVSTVKDEGNEEFYECIKDLVHHPYVLRMKEYPRHCETSCYQHCLNVAYYNFRICKFFGLDARSAARAGMLHDLFLYDWRGHRKKTGDPVHAMTHPHTALHNAKKILPAQQAGRRDDSQAHVSGDPGSAHAQRDMDHYPDG